MELLDSPAQSIATMEGYFKPNMIAQRNNNPGNPRSWGANPVKNGPEKPRTCIHNPLVPGLSPGRSTSFHWTSGCVFSECHRLSPKL